MKKLFLCFFLFANVCHSKAPNKDKLFDKALSIYAQNRSGDLSNRLLDYEREVKRYCRQDKKCTELLSHALNVRLNIKYVRLAVSSTKEFKSKLKEIIKSQEFYLQNCHSGNCQDKLEKFCQLYKDSRELPAPLCLGLFYFKSQVAKKYLK